MSPLWEATISSVPALGRWLDGMPLCDDVAGQGLSYWSRALIPLVRYSPTSYGSASTEDHPFGAEISDDFQSSAECLEVGGECADLGGSGFGAFDR